MPRPDLSRRNLLARLPFAVAGLTAPLVAQAQSVDTPYSARVRWWQIFYLNGTDFDNINKSLDRTRTGPIGCFSLHRSPGWFCARLHSYAGPGHL